MAWVVGDLTAAQFLTELFGTALADHPEAAIGIVSPGANDPVERLPTVADAIAYVEERRKTSVYVCCGLQQRRMRTYRDPGGDVLGITAAWADVDIAGSRREKKCFADRAAADRWIDELPLKPNVTVWSGNGYHLWWILKEPYWFEQENDRHYAADVLRRWGGFLTLRAKQHHVDLDTVSDLARVLRVPETQNMHYQPPLPVTAEYDAALARIELSTLEEMAGTVHVAAVRSRPDDCGPVAIVPPHAEAPRDKLELLKTNNPGFARTWAGRRAEKWSQSEYDMSIAAHCVRAGWDDHEITCAIVQHRRDRDKDISKAARKDYIPDTIAKVRASVVEESIRDDAFERLAEEIKTMGADAQTVYAQTSQLLAIPITKCLQHSLRDAVYSLVLGDGREIQIGSSLDVLNQRRTRALLLEGARVLPPGLSGKRWEVVVAALIQVSELIVADEEEPAEKGQEWVKAYVHDFGICDGTDWSVGLSNGQPFRREDGRIYINLPAFRLYIQNQCGERSITRREVRSILRQAGFKSEQVTGRYGKRIYRRWCWAAPADPFLPVLVHENPESGVGGVGGVGPTETVRHTAAQSYRDV